MKKIGIVYRGIGGMGMDKGTSMTKGTIWKAIVYFSIPLLIGNVFQQLYNTVDSIVVGNYVGKEALAAVGSCTVIINMLVGFFMGLSTGASVVISQYYGANEHKKLHDAVHTSIVMTLLLGIIMTFVGILLSPTLLNFMKTPSDVMPSSSLYLRIYFGGILGLMVYNMGSAILRAIGDSKRPLYFLIFSSIVNTVLDLVFVIVFDMGVAGVAWATLIAQVLSAILVIIVLVRSKEAYRIILKDLCLNKEMFMKMLKIGLPAGLQQSITAFSNIFVQGYINVFGSSAMAGWSSYIKIDQFVILPVQSIALASTTFVGQNLGAKDVKRAKQGTKTSLGISLAVTIFLSILLNIFGNQILSIFSQDPEVLKYGNVFLRIFSPFYFALCFNQIYAGALRGAGDSNAPMVIMLFCFVVFRQLTLFIGTKFFSSLNFVAFSYPLGWMLCSILLVLYYYKGNWQKKLDSVVD